jgi:hypothetical protein
MLDDRAGDLAVAVEFGWLSLRRGLCGRARLASAVHGKPAWPSWCPICQSLHRKAPGARRRAELRRLLSLAWRAPGGRGSVRLCRRVGRLDRPAGARRARAKRARRAPRGPLLGGAPRDLPPGSRSVEKSLEWRPEGAKFSSARALQRPPGAAPSGRRYHIILHSLIATWPCMRVELAIC